MKHLTVIIVMLLLSSTAISQDFQGLQLTNLIEK